MNPLKTALSKRLVLAALVLLAVVPKIQATVLFDDDFQSSQSLDGWKDIFGKSGEDLSSSEISVDSEGGNYFVRASTGFGETALLGSPLTIDDTISTVTIQTRIRNSASIQGAIGLTTRTAPEGSAGFLFKSTDSGFYALGYQYNGAHTNLIAWQNDPASDPDATGTAYTGALLSAVNTWNTWKLVLDVSAQTLSIYLNDSATPAMVEDGVDLHGVTLNSLWVRNGSGSQTVDYDDIQVSYETVPEPGGMALMGAGLLAFCVFRFRARARRA